MKKTDHIGVAVKSIEEALPFYTNMLALTLLKQETVDSQGVKVAFLDAGNIKIELLEPLNSDSPIAAFINKRGEGIHHVAFGVSDIDQRMEELKSKGLKFTSEGSKTGAGGAQVAFLHPKQAHGVLYELCDHDYKGGSHHE
ncbi:methylmalonyl-CoA epimerase [Jeotgalibacillus terrae]|uniref:Methylmalonyl-CoA epimerase n=1 Tax=Jeotgalibacillus terrae TaxID=587735 RepID=A0ABW5ZLA7_9BACL|nr:methylmalonyl-CoA epimerase [Jeotgalibacillus terrae]MBM7577516.1 methylmalonyl-CoA/ethylmalonyl-CoA epimerase [Jeotgalibacillus terrae]